MRTWQTLLLVGMATAAGGCETATNVVNCAALAVFASDEVKPQPADVVDVHASAETEPVTNPCDAADDPAIRPDVEDELYGMCLYQRPADGTLYAFATDKSGGVTQWRLDAVSGGRLTGREARSWQTGVETEGCVVDDANGWLYVGAQNDGIWRYDADPDREVVRTVVDTTGVEVNSGGRLAGDIEGLALYAGRSGDPSDGYLVASSQGNDTFVVYDRAAPHAYRGTFSVVGHDGIDGVEGTDGLDVTSTPLGPEYPGGLLVVMDGENTEPDGSTANQNFKLVSWQAVADALRLD